MTDGEYTFKQTVKERSNLKRNAIYKKNGCKSKKCTLPSDRLSKKERDKMNGPVQSIMMSRPCNNWKQFRSLPETLQHEYIEGLIKNYEARACDIAQMFGVSYATIYAAFHKNIKFPAGGAAAKMSEKFMDFLTTPEEKSDSTIETKLVAPPLYKKKETDISMQKITLGQLRQYLNCEEYIEVVMKNDEWKDYSAIKASSKLLDPFNDWIITELAFGDGGIITSTLLPRVRICEP